MKILMMLVLLVSCGRKDNDNKCRSSEEMTLECQVVNTPTYGRVYAQRVCSEQYSAKRCW